jgi:hypothetical protein
MLFGIRAHVNNVAVLAKKRRSACTRFVDFHSHAMPTAPRIVTKVRVYLDFNGVLNVDDMEVMMGFIIDLWHLVPDIWLDLLSFAGGEERCYETLEYLEKTGIIDLFDTIIFTQKRDRFDNEPRRNRWRHLFPGAHDLRLTRSGRAVEPLDSIPFVIWPGGKDEYIAQHWLGASATIFVDDKPWNVRHAMSLVPSLRGCVRLRNNERLRDRSMLRVCSLQDVLLAVSQANHAMSAH